VAVVCRDERGHTVVEDAPGDFAALTPQGLQLSPVDDLIIRDLAREALPAPAGVTMSQRLVASGYRSMVGVSASADSQLFVVAFWSVDCFEASPLCVVAPLPVPSAGLAFCVLLFVPEVAAPLLSVVPDLAVGFCSVVVPLPASCDPGLVSVEALPEALPLVEDLSWEGCSALFWVSEPWPDFCCDDWPLPCGQAPDASGVQSVPVPAALEPDCEPESVPV